MEHTLTIHPVVPYSREDLFKDINFNVRHHFSDPSEPIEIETFLANHYIDEFSDEPHNESKKHYEVDNTMSFVGMFAMRNGIVAFGDTRSTITNAFGMPCEEKDRVTKKVFMGKDYLLTTWSANRIHVDNYEFSDDSIRMEDFLEEHVKDSSPLELLSLFVTKTSRCIRNYNLEYHFGIGYKLEERFVVQEATVKQNTLILSLPTSKIWVGTEFYQKREFAVSSRDIKTAFGEIKEKVGSIMNEAATIDGYNPAGGKIYFGLLGDGLEMVE